MPERFDSTYVPRQWAIPVHNFFGRFMALVIHRRAGKTSCALNQHIRAASNDHWERRRLLALAERDGFTFSELDLKDLMRERQYGHILPTRVQAKFAAWDLLKHYASFHPRVVARESMLSVTFPGGHRVQLFGADKPDSFRGGRFSGLSLDEYGMLPPNVFSEVLSKNCADHLAYVMFLGTIKGKNQLYKTYDAAKGDPGWLTVWQNIDQSLANERGATIVTLRQAMADDRDLISKALMTQEEYDQEWYLSTTAAIKGSIYGTLIATMQKEGRIRRVPYDEQFPCFDVWDIGKGPNMSVGIYQRIMRELRMIDYVEGAESDGLPQILKALRDRPYIYSKHFAPHDIMGTEFTTGKTRYETAKRLGWPFTVVPNIGVAEGIMAGKAAMARLWVDEQKGAPFLEAIGFYRRPWNEKTQQFGAEPVHDFASHPADQWRYAAVIEDQMTNERVRKRPTGPAPPPPKDGLAWMAT